MSGTHNRLEYGNNFHHWKLSDLVVDLNYFSFPHHNPNPNLTHLPKHEFLRPNNQFYQRIWYVEYYSVHVYVVWSQKFSLTPACRLDIFQDNEFVTGYGYPKTAFKREPDTDPGIRNAFIDISRIQTLEKSCTLHNHSFINFRSIFSAFCAMTPSLSMV